MKMFAALAVLTLAVPGYADSGTAQRKVPRPASVAPKGWNARVVATADGGFLVGNPAAKAKFVEYGSLTCPYCERFYTSAVQPLRARIASGQVSFEFRPFGVHDADPILHALLSCAGPANFNRFVDDFYADQERLAAAFERWVGANPSVNANADAATRIRLAGEWGFTAFAQSHGLTPAKTAICLSNQPAIDAQRAREERAYRDRGVNGTPTFFLNGAPLPATSWGEIDAALNKILS